MANGEKNVSRYVDVISNFMMQFWNERERTWRHVHEGFSNTRNKWKQDVTWHVHDESKRRV